jgi:heat shock protein HslJ
VSLSVRAPGLATLVLAMLVAACTPSAATPAPTATPVASTDTGTGEIQLDGTSWLLIGYTSPGGSHFTVPMSITPTLVFGDGTVTGNAGCNTFGGTWTLEGEDFDVTGPLESTGNPCEDPGATIEKAYLANLDLMNRVELRGENLFMSKTDALPDLEFIPAAG